MRPVLPRLCASMAAAAALAITSSALAQGDRTASAQLLFDDAMQRMKRGDYTTACPKFEESQRLDPGLGTQYRLAECYVGVGRLASAWSLFVEVSNAAERAGSPDRAADARGRAASLAPRLRRVRITLSPEAAAVPGLTIRRNGEGVAGALFNQPLPVDASAQQIEASAPGKTRFATRVEVGEGATVALTIPGLADAPAAVDDGTGDTQRIVGIVLGAAGVAGIGAGVVGGIVANHNWHDALSHCQGGAHDQCDANGISSASHANTFANVANVGIIAGGTLLAAGIVVFLVAPHSAPVQSGAVTFTFGASPGGASARFGGVF